MSAIRINGVRVDLMKCSHCGAEPDEVEALAAIQAYLASRGDPKDCVACGLSVIPDAYTIEHIGADGEPPAWRALPQPGAWCHVGVAIGSPAVTRGYKLHLACATKALPHMDLDALLNPPRPWPSIEKIRGVGGSTS